MVSKKQTPWGLIAATAVVVLLVAGIIVYVVMQSNGKKTVDGDPAYTRNELPAAAAIQGVTYKKEPDHNHVTSAVKYDSSPPVGGNHSQYWADCTGTVYPKQIANENAVHALEHGAVWITYRPGLSSSQVSTLSKLVNGNDRMLMSPYAGLKTPISLQAWGYQLFVNSADDPRVQKFITALRFNKDTTPEPNASCSDPQFKTSPSTPGNPLF